MKISPFLLGLALATAPATAQTAVTNIAPLPATANAPKMATVTPFITGLKEPQGLAFDSDKNLLVCDYGAGEILTFSRDGKALGKLATGLKGPSAIERVARQIFVTERKANRVVRFRDGKMDVVLDDVPEPIGLVVDSLITGKGDGTPFSLSVVSHTTSKIHRLNLTALSRNRERELIYAAPGEEGQKGRYGFRWLVRDGGIYLMSDEVGEKILMVNLGGRVATFATGISDPSGIAISPDNQVYVANEGDGGQLIRLNSEGEKTIVAEKLGRPRGILFLDAKTVLVSNRDGNIWKVAPP